MHVEGERPSCWASAEKENQPRTRHGTGAHWHLCVFAATAGAKKETAWTIEDYLDRCLLWPPTTLCLVFLNT